MTSSNRLAQLPAAGRRGITLAHDPFDVPSRGVLEQRDGEFERAPSRRASAESRAAGGAAPDCQLDDVALRRSDALRRPTGDGQVEAAFGGECPSATSMLGVLASSSRV
jgi:hypothetical protein